MRISDWSSDVCSSDLKTPLLIVYALVNTVWMTDLQADRSMVRNLLEQGEDVYLIDWGYPDGADRWLTLDDYINSYLDRCLDAVRARHALDALNLHGICQARKAVAEGKKWTVRVKPGG